MFSLVFFNPGYLARFPLAMVRREGREELSRSSNTCSSLTFGPSQLHWQQRTRRLAAMQRAENNIRERKEELNARYHSERQSFITEELLDVISGFEALTTDPATRQSSSTEKEGT